MFGTVNFVGSAQQKKLLENAGMKWFEGKVFRSWKHLQEAVEIAEMKMYLSGLDQRQGFVHAFSFLPIQITKQERTNAYLIVKAGMRKSSIDMVMLLLLVNIPVLVMALILASIGSISEILPLFLSLTAVLTSITWVTVYRLRRYWVEVPKRIAAQRNKNAKPLFAF